MPSIIHNNQWNSVKISKLDKNNKYTINWDSNTFLTTF